MSNVDDDRAAPVIMHPDGSLQVGTVLHEPWPSLAVFPERAQGFHQEIIRADPGSPFFAFASRIPDGVRQLVRVMPSYQWGILELVAAHPAFGHHLLQHCPALATLIVRHYRPMIHGDRTTYLRGSLTRPWRELLCEFHLPPRPRTRRILGMLPPAHCYPLVVDKLMRVLQTTDHRWIHVVPHLRRITRDTVWLLSIGSTHVNAHLLRASVDTDHDSTEVFSTLISVRQLLSDLGRDHEWPYHQATYEQLKVAEGRLHDRCYVDFCLPFPAPPIPARPGVIEPIRDYGSLVDEGIAQDNCVATLVAEVVRGEFYVYRVFAPTRATLALQRSGNTWQIYDLRAARNADVPAETLALTGAWLKAHRPEN